MEVTYVLPLFCSQDSSAQECFIQIVAMSFALACSHLQTKIGSPCVHLMTLPEKTEYGS